MTKKQLDQQEKHLTNQSRILNESLDFWQWKALDQIQTVDKLRGNSNESKKSYTYQIPKSNQEKSETIQKAEKELEYYMVKLQWENLQLQELDDKIKKLLEDKKKYNSKKSK